MSILESSRTESQNLPFYLNDFDEQKCNFITFRLKGNLEYSNIISGNFVKLTYFKLTSTFYLNINCELTHAQPILARMTVN